MTANRVISAKKWELDAAPDPKVALEVCEAVAFGRSLADIERDPHFPPRDLFISWVMRDPTLALAFQRAREMSSYVLEDEALELLRARLAAPGSSVELRAADLFVQQLRWSAGKRNPAVFSDKSTVNVTVPVQINTSLDMGETGAVQSRSRPNVYELRADVTREVDTPREEDIRSPDLLEPGAPVPLRVAKKRILRPKPRAAETAVEREVRLTAERRAEEDVLARAILRRKASTERKRRHRERLTNARNAQG